MADNAERIAALEAEIEGYKQELKNAAPENKAMYAGLIVERNKTLNLLLQAQPGKTPSLPSYVLHKLSI